MEATAHDHRHCCRRVLFYSCACESPSWQQRQRQQQQQRHVTTIRLILAWGLTLWMLHCSSLVAAASTTSLSLSSSSTSSFRNANKNKAENDKADGGNAENSPCGIYLAPSTVPGAGHGMFASRDFCEGQVLSSGDLAVPIWDIEFHNGLGEFPFLWDDFALLCFALVSSYVWVSKSFGTIMDNEETSIGESTDVAAFGIGAAANFMYGLDNVESSYIQKLTVDLDNDDFAGTAADTAVGLGAYTPYYNHQGLATTNITAGSELFIDYGSDYFDAKPHLGVPTLRHYLRLRKWLQLFQKWRRSGHDAAAAYNSPSLSPPWLNTLLKFLLSMSKIYAPNPYLRILPGSFDELDRLLATATSLKTVPARHLAQAVQKHKTIRSVDWIQQHGTCMDNLRAGLSTIPHAGHGAFAKRFIAKGQAIAPAPLIPIANKSMLDMYHVLDPSKSATITTSNNSTTKRLNSPNIKTNKTKPQRDVSRPPYHQQLLLNYCFGHASTDILLCPYGVGTSLINHAPNDDTKQVNAKIMWSHKHTTHPEWLDLPLSHHSPLLLHQPGLAFDYVATRDIAPGDEVLIDYGQDWQTAWDSHVQTWQQQQRRQQQQSKVRDWRRHKEWPVPTVSEGGCCSQGQVQLECHEWFRIWWGLEPLEVQVQEYGPDASSAKFFVTWPCRVTHRFVDTKTNEIRYNVELLDWDENHKTRQCVQTVDKVLLGVPRDIFHFVDLDARLLPPEPHQQPWSFRHAMGIPDDMLPDAWRIRCQ